MTFFSNSDNILIALQEILLAEKLLNEQPNVAQVVENYEIVLKKYGLVYDKDAGIPYGDINHFKYGLRSLPVKDLCDNIDEWIGSFGRIQTDITVPGFHTLYRRQSATGIILSELLKTKKYLCRPRSSITRGRDRGRRFDREDRSRDRSRRFDREDRSRRFDREDRSRSRNRSRNRSHSAGKRKSRKFRKSRKSRKFRKSRKSR